MTRPDYEALDRQPRRRRKVCAYDNTELEQRAGWLHCPGCGKTPDEMVQPPRQYTSWDEVPSSATPEHAGQVAF